MRGDGNRDCCVLPLSPSFVLWGRVSIHVPPLSGHRLFLALFQSQLSRDLGSRRPAPTCCDLTGPPRAPPASTAPRPHLVFCSFILHLSLSPSISSSRVPFSFPPFLSHLFFPLPLSFIFSPVSQVAVYFCWIFIFFFLLFLFSFASDFLFPQLEVIFLCFCSSQSLGLRLRFACACVCEPGWGVGRPNPELTGQTDLLSEPGSAILVIGPRAIHFSQPGFPYL